MLDYRVLGALQVLDDGIEVDITAPKARATLLVLLLHPRQVVSADGLIDALWPESPPPSARKLVQVYVSQLRSALGPEAIETVTGGYRMRVAPDALDVARFEQLWSSGRRAAQDGNPELALALAGRALAQWRGPALADVAADPFASAEAARLDEQRLECTEDRLQAELELGRHEEALAELLRLCHQHPLRERARERLALALYRCDRQGEALAELAEGRRLLRDELGLEPAPSHRALERAILEQDPALTVAAAAPPTTIVPGAASPLVGRHHEVAQITELVARPDARIVTITGAGGSGKTRVALEVARSAGSHFANGAAFVELAAVREPTRVLSAIAQALSVPETPDAPVGLALAGWLRSRNLLLVVDNLEHVIEAAGELTGLVQQAPHVTLLITSRRVLHVAGEHVFPLSPLPLDDAARLFSERAIARDLSLDLSDDDAVVRGICQRLDCLPLALELAAARTSMLSVPLLLERLSGSVAALGSGPRDAPARQQTLADTLRWSTDLLSEREKRTLARLSTFAGGCTIEAAEVVCEAEVDDLAALVDSSLLQRTIVAGVVRLTMLETVREHAEELLVTSGADTAAIERHLAYHRSVAERAELKGPRQAASLVEVDTELENLRLAFDRAEALGDDETALRIGVALYRYWYLRGRFREGCDRIGGPLERGAGSPDLQALALRALAGLQFMLGELDTASRTARRGVEVARAAGADMCVMACHTVLSHIARERERYAEAQAHLEQSEALAEGLGLAEDVMVANTNLGELALATGDLEQARRRWERTLAFYGGRDQENTTFARLGLGAVAHRQDRLDDAAVHFAAALELAELSGFWHNATMALIGLAGVAAAQAAHADAAVLLGRASALLEATGGDLTHADEAVRDEATAVAVAGLGDQRMAELFDAGVRQTAAGAGRR